ncbi:MAG: hypothetical protein RAK24_03775, partial [TACK group archaeon]|nr:hypothetical protein [TACK group archaeon]
MSGNRPKVTVIGAGSHVFGLAIARDLVTYPELKGMTLSLMDISPERLEFTASLVKRLLERMGAEIKLEVTTDRKMALMGFDYVFEVWPGVPLVAVFKCP